MQTLHSPSIFPLTINCWMLYLSFQSISHRERAEYINFSRTYPECPWNLNNLRYTHVSNYSRLFMSCSSVSMFLCRIIRLTKRYLTSLILNSRSNLEFWNTFFIYRNSFLDSSIVIFISTSLFKLLSRTPNI